MNDMNDKPLQAALSVESLSFGYQTEDTLKNITFDVNPGEVACLIGPSGCGKSTLLRLIAGFEQPRSGRISLNGKCLSDRDQVLPPQHRGVGMLFQDLALFPHLTVTQNLAYGLQQGNENRVKELLSLCRLSEYKDRYPHQLSGGQKQRVALARAMAPKPDLILLDEPFSSVDSDLQNAMVMEVRDMLVEDHATALWVTHSLSEACAVADHVGVMLAGELMQFDQPETLFEQPQNKSVAAFLNRDNIIQAQPQAGGLADSVLGVFGVSNASDITSMDGCHILLKPERIKLKANPSQKHLVKRCHYVGGYYLIEVTLENGEDIVVHHDTPMGKNQTVDVAYRCEHQQVRALLL